MMNRNIVKIAVLVFTAFTVIVFYQTYLQVFQSSRLFNHPRNRRTQMLEEAIIRGRIIDSAGRELAHTITAGPEKRRIYPYGETTAHITGYNSDRYGRWGLESSYNETLLGLQGGFTGDDFWALKRIGPVKNGNDLILSVNVNLQEKAYAMLGARKGAVVAVEPSTGRILAMVSRPGFNPEHIESDWPGLKENPDSPLLNRAAQGLYPPGSVMKVITAAGILTSKPETVQRVFDAPGYIIVEGRRIEDKQAVGRLSFAEAFARSSNYVFATLGIEQGSRVFAEMARSFGLGLNIPFDIPTAQSRMPDPGSLSKLELAESAIGQGRVLVTPLNMALATAAAANRGRVMKPTLVDRIVSPEGAVVWSGQPSLLWNPVTARVSDVLREIMVSCVASGTGREAAVPGIRVAGKTGSAENPHGQPHAWFIGFAPAEKPVVAVAVIIENGGAGGREAAPIAREIIRSVIGQKR
ncbi:MAG: hypothetical protein CVV03_08390 [Firmicutes bacterium HGW-Firmicutes-8]|nr:MAG: hypothetical protein CVV03_08390 [Firmicutes bacterium HGW-Firmicutes-8]